MIFNILFIHLKKENQIIFYTHLNKLLPLGPAENPYLSPCNLIIFKSATGNYVHKCVKFNNIHWTKTGETEPNLLKWRFILNLFTF